ncbi:hypothetical protein AN958_08143 [Leucoagaricus sp. SymC.cos]|nr:hypothetical protein AN958_08143 [Leucoagaricus sp. SymC.cos]
MTFSNTAAHLTGNFCEAVAFGIYLVTCILCVRVLFKGSGKEERRRRPSEIHWFLAIIALVMFILCTLNVLLGFVRNFYAFVESKHAGKALVGAYVPDLFLVRKLLNHGSQTMSDVTECLDNNILIRRIWLVDRSTKDFRMGDERRYLHEIMVVFAESGAAYMTIVLITLILVAAHSNALYLVSALARIAFNVIRVQCSPERDRRFTTFHQHEILTPRLAHQNRTSESVTVINQQDKSHAKELIDRKSEARVDEQSSHNDLNEKVIRVAREDESQV